MSRPVRFSCCGDYVTHPRVRHIHDDATLSLSLTETAADDRVQQSMHAFSIHQRRTAVHGVNITCPEVHARRFRCRPPLLDCILGQYVERCCRAGIHPKADSLLKCSRGPLDLKIALAKRHVRKPHTHARIHTRRRKLRTHTHKQYMFAGLRVAFASSQVCTEWRMCVRKSITCAYKYATLTVAKHVVNALQV